MKIISIISQKGGVGKSTICSNLAVLAHHEGHKVVMIDDDPQGSLQEWWEERENEQPAYANIEAKVLRESVEALEDAGYDYLFIDTAGALAKELPKILEITDYVIVPTQPKKKDFKALKRTLQIIHDAGTPYSFIVNRVDRRSNAWFTAMRELSQISTVAAVIGENSAFEKADEKSLGVIEHSPKSKSANELKELWNNLKSYLKRNQRKAA